MSNSVLLAALKAAVAVLENGGEAVTHSSSVVAAPSVSDRVADFLRNDQSGFQKRTAEAIAKALGDVSADQVRASVSQSNGDLAGSQGRIGYLIWLN